MTIGKYKGKDHSMGFRTGHFYIISIDFDTNNCLFWVREWPGTRFCPYSTMEKLKKDWDIGKKATQAVSEKTHYFKLETNLE